MLQSLLNLPDDEFRAQLERVRVNLAVRNQLGMSNTTSASPAADIGKLIETHDRNGLMTELDRLMAAADECCNHKLYDLTKGMNSQGKSIDEIRSLCIDRSRDTTISRQRHAHICALLAYWTTDKDELDKRLTELQKRMIGMQSNCDDKCAGFFKSIDEILKWKSDNWEES